MNDRSVTISRYSRKILQRGNILPENRVIGSPISKLAVMRFYISQIRTGPSQKGKILQEKVKYIYEESAKRGRSEDYWDREEKTWKVDWKRQVPCEVDGEIVDCSTLRQLIIKAVFPDNGTDSIYFSVHAYEWTAKPGCPPWEEIFMDDWTIPAGEMMYLSRDYFLELDSRYGLWDRFV